VAVGGAADSAGLPRRLARSRPAAEARLSDAPTPTGRGVPALGAGCGLCGVLGGGVGLLAPVLGERPRGGGRRPLEGATPLASACSVSTAVRACSAVTRFHGAEILWTSCLPRATLVRDEAGRPRARISCSPD
jgi:hypothetical protein